ncbi:MAG: lipoyl(octanoyl) transferase LipB [Anaerolineae bacterium]|nr:lipoyl(octanoyl) transferase LipB [Anaerolineae bacterium]
MDDDSSLPLKTVNVLNLDLEPYGQALRLQHLLVAARRDARIEDTLVLLRHPPVITLGRRGDERHILASPKRLEQHGIEVFRVERGGDVTYHGPGQLVGYPIIDLKRLGGDVGWYMHSLEELLLRTLHDFGIIGRRLPGHIGVWLDERTKVASLGVRVETWIAYHGFALNVGDDPSYSALILPCGLPEVEMSSMQRALGQQVDMNLVRERVVHHFCDVFGLTARGISMESVLPPPELAVRPASSCKGQ